MNYLSFFGSFNQHGVCVCFCCSSSVAIRFPCIYILYLNIFIMLNFICLIYQRFYWYSVFHYSDIFTGDILMLLQTVCEIFWIIYASNESKVWFNCNAILTIKWLKQLRCYKNLSLMSEAFIQRDVFVTARKLTRIKHTLWLQFFKPCYYLVILSRANLFSFDFSSIISHYSWL